MTASCTKIINQIARATNSLWYLQIGLQNSGNYRAIKVPGKVSVDPVDHGNPPTFQMTSNEFFGMCPRRFDIVFINSLSDQQQFFLDIENSLRFLNPNGFIICKNIKPPNSSSQTRDTQSEMNWQFWLDLQASRPELCMAAFDCDEGVGVIHPKIHPNTSRSQRTGNHRIKQIAQQLLSNPEHLTAWLDYQITPFSPSKTLSRPKILIYVRTNINWRLVNHTNFLDLKDAGREVWVKHSNHASRALLKRIKIWDKCFNIPFFWYRKRLQEIAERSWLSLDYLDGIIRDPGILLDIVEKHHSIVLPTDDDDWYHPRLTEALQGFDFSTNELATWHHLRYRPTFRQRSERSEGKLAFSSSPFQTNNYCLTSNFLQEVGPTEFLRFLRCHGAAMKGDLHARIIPSVLSAKIKSPASITLLRRLNESSIQKIREHVRIPMPTIPNKAAWARQYLTSMESLNSKL